MSVDQAAEYCGFGRHAVRDALAAGVLRGIRIGRIIRVPVAELDRFISEAAENGLDLADLRLSRRALWPSQIPSPRRRANS